MIKLSSYSIASNCNAILLHSMFCGSLGIYITLRMAIYKAQKLAKGLFPLQHCQ